MERLNLYDDIFDHSKEVLTCILQGGEQLTRKAIYHALELENISTADQRGLQILWQLALEGLICFGPREGKQQTFVLMDEWIPKTKSMKRNEAMSKLARRYFISHGPATVHDFAWWSGLKIADARKALEMTESQFAQKEVYGQTYWFSNSSQITNDFSKSAYLLPSYDEYMISYKDRSASLNPIDAKKLKLNNRLYSAMIINGRVIGTWKHVLKKDKVVLKLFLFNSLSEEENHLVNFAAEQYSHFINKPYLLKKIDKFE